MMKLSPNSGDIITCRGINFKVLDDNYENSGRLLVITNEPIQIKEVMPTDFSVSLNSENEIYTLIYDWLKRTGIEAYDRNIAISPMDSVNPDEEVIFEKEKIFLPTYDEVKKYKKFLPAIYRDTEMSIFTTYTNFLDLDEIEVALVTLDSSYHINTHFHTRAIYPVLLINPPMKEFTNEELEDILHSFVEMTWLPYEPYTISSKSHSKTHSDCESCLTNPKNGGSGICWCPSGLPETTY